MLISEQICEETERRENETIAELRETIFEMRKALQDKEFVIQELEKVKPVHQEEGMIIKYKEVNDLVFQLGNNFFLKGIDPT